MVSTIRDTEDFIKIFRKDSKHKLNIKSLSLQTDADLIESGKSPSEVEASSQKKFSNKSVLFMAETKLDFS